MTRSVEAKLSAAFVGYLCDVFGTEDDPCVAGTLLYAALGAGGGALIGAGIDSLFVRKRGAVFSVRF